MSVGTRLRDALTCTPYRFQVRGVRFVEKHNGRALIADDMGLGKTLQSIGWCAINPEKRPVVVVCPAPLKYNWQREFKKHARMESFVCNGTLPTDEQLDLKLQKKITSLKHKYAKVKRGLRKAISNAKKSTKEKKSKMALRRKRAKRAEILIINYDIIDEWVPLLKEIEVQVLIMDECQYVKNRKAKRTKACKEISKIANHVIALSGTPIAGKPAEFFPVLQMIRPDEFTSWWKFGFQYCSPTRSPFGGAWEFKGASNLEALHERLKTVMIRRMKREVLKDLPEKTRTIMPLDIGNRREYEKAETNFLSWLRKRKGTEAMLRAERAQAIVRLNALKLLAAEGKMKLAMDWVGDWLNDTDEKLIIFAYHKVIMDVLKKAYPKAAVVDGSVTGLKRQKAVDKFQQDPNCRLFIGHRQAAGTGLTLTAACNVLFLEIGWTPGEHDQAEDRALRIGQTKHVNVYYLVGKNTVEERILSIIEEKDSTVAQILDGKQSGGMDLMNRFLAAVESEETKPKLRIRRKG